MRPAPPRPTCAPQWMQSLCAKFAARRAALQAARCRGHPTQTLSLAHYRLRLKPNQDRDRLRRRCPALYIMIGERQQWIGLGIVGADGAYRDAVRFRPEPAHDSPLSVVGERFGFDHIALAD